MALTARLISRYCPWCGGSSFRPGHLAQRAPDGFGRLDAVPLCGLVFRQDDAMAVVRAAAYGHGHAAQLRVAQQLYRGIKAVAVAVKDHALFFRGKSAALLSGTVLDDSQLAPSARRCPFARPPCAGAGPCVRPKARAASLRLCRPAPACKFSALLHKNPRQYTNRGGRSRTACAQDADCGFCFVRRKIFLCGPALRIVRRRPRFLLLIITFCSIIQNT